MTFSKRARNQLFESNQNLICLVPQPPGQTTTRTRKRRIRIRRQPGAKKDGDPWTKDEHERFLADLEAYPSGPWKMVTPFVMTRTTRQTMTHAQKYRQKIERWQRIYSASELASLQSSPPDNDGAETEDSDAVSGVAPSPRCKNQPTESPSVNPIKFESPNSGVPEEEVASESLHRSESFEAIDALLSNWQPLLSVDSEEELLDLEILSDLNIDLESEC